MPSATASQLTGSAIGVLFFALFGSAWLSLGLAATHQLTRTTGLLIGADLLLLVLLAGRRPLPGPPAPFGRGGMGGFLA